MPWRKTLRDDPISQLLASDNAGVRYLALRDLLNRSEEDPELKLARRAAHAEGPIAAILAEMQPEGYWVNPGAGYGPKYFSTVWAVITLAQLGACIREDERVAHACAYVLDNALTPAGQFSSGGPSSPADTVDCLQGNLCWALVRIGCENSRLEKAYEWMARTVTGEGLAGAEDKKAPQRYYAAKCGPNFACDANNKLPCAWGAAKVMLAFSVWPLERRTELIERAIQAGVNFLFSVDPATAAYPCGWAEKPSSNWWKFGFPVFYITDLLQVVEALAGLGYGRDPRLANALALVREKQGADGFWPLEYDYAGKTWGDYGPKKQPNPWVTLRALGALKQAG